MPLPVASSALPPDVAVQGWAAITVQVAWTLRSLGVRPKRALRDARDHVLFHLDPTVPLSRAEDLADHLTRGFVARARGQILDQRWAQDINMPPSARWRRAIEESADRMAAVAFRHHYGACVPLERIAEQAGLDLLSLQVARGGLRATLRRIAVEDELPLQGWSDERIDHMLRRLASYSPYDSPPLVEVAEGCHAEWVSRCPRCERTIRLVRAGILAPEDLDAPVGAARPSSRIEVLAVQFTPEARRHRALIAREAGGHVQSLGEDMLLLGLGPGSRASQTLTLAAELGRPGRDGMRTARVAGPGRWSSSGLLGPLVEQASGRLRSQPWGAIDGEGELPEVLPQPPSARWAWAAVFALGCAVIGAGLFALGPGRDPSEIELSGSFTAGRGGVWARFSTADLAEVVLVREVQGQLDVVFETQGAGDKAALAVGDGTYLVHTPGQRVLLAASAQPFEGLERLLETAQGAKDPLHDLSLRLRTQRPRSAVLVSR